MDGSKVISEWKFWIDVGGTFTDCLAQSPNGEEFYFKVLSSGLTKGEVSEWASAQSFVAECLVNSQANFWNGATVSLIDGTGQVISRASVRQFNANSCEISLDRSIAKDQRELIDKFELDLGVHSPILAIRQALRKPISEPVSKCQVFLGTTRGTNALLTRDGARTALVTSLGFRDMLTIGDQSRPHLFELTVKKPDSLFDVSIEVQERVLADGTVEQAPDLTQVKAQLRELKESGIESLAICFMHGYRYPVHEKLVGELALEMDFRDVRLSHEVAPLIKIIPRGETTVLDAFLNPVIGRYLDEINANLSSDSQLRLMTSAGGLVSRARFSGKDSVLSGPAGGVVGAARVAEQAGFSRMIGFDMGGTSTDVSRYEGNFDKDFESTKAGVRIVAPMMSIETVAAGGGSLCRVNDGRLVVGPGSAGADPGPACYGRGGPLTITDMNLMLGRLNVKQFPFPLDRRIVERKLGGLCQELNGNLAMDQAKLNPISLATGFLKIANHNMATAIRSISVAKGYDPKEYVLVSFGGAGSQHCCAVADNLGITKVLDHPHSSLLSAVGIRLAEQSSHAVESVMEVLKSESIEALEGVFVRLELAAIRELVEEGVDRSQIALKRALDLRYLGTDSPLTIPCPLGNDYESSFNRTHQNLFGYQQERKVEVLAARVEATASRSELLRTRPTTETNHRTTKQQQSTWHLGSETMAQLFCRSELQCGDVVVGPTIIASNISTTIVDPGWNATMLADGQLLLERTKDNGRDSLTAADAGELTHDEPIQLEIFNSHFSSVARQMGIVLQKTSTSVNVKERLDFSCAVFGETGDLVVNAPHIPVHLGAMSETVRAIIGLNEHVNCGDVFVTNDPYKGGSHLPDVTVVTPVFGNEPIPMFWVASRSHHAEIGGKAPGSMPANATRLGEEGVLIQNFKLIDRGQDRFDALVELLSSGEYPSRSPMENVADIKAQVAANRRGEKDLIELVQKYGLPVVQRFMRLIQDAAETKARKALANMPNGCFTFEDSLDNGATIRLSIAKQGSQIEFGFTGTDPVISGNLNANSAIVKAAVMYVLRCLIADDIPLNEGVINPVQIDLPECFLNPTPNSNPADSPAVVGGNVETSQRVVDVVLGALGVAAASCGTMNNWLMGDKTFGYYETVGGGAGATRSGNGASAVHTHMTNTRLTDPEVLETRYPVVLREFSIRPGSGGKGRFTGGDGMRREIEFREPLTVSLMTNRRKLSPFGLEGGKPGLRGKNLLQRKDDSETEELASQCEVDVNRGDRLILLTPGGGGFGDPD